MAGHYPNKEKVTQSLQNWLSDVTQSETSWKGNNLHVDEIQGLLNIKREEWIDCSFSVFNILLSQIVLPKPLLVFLHIDLSFTKAKESVDVVTINWLKDNINEFTPPSFNCTTLDYYKTFYKKELHECDIDKSILSHFGFNSDLSLFYRTYFDDSEEMYSREAYIFKMNVDTKSS